MRCYGRTAVRARQSHSKELDPGHSDILPTQLNMMTVMQCRRGMGGWGGKGWGWGQVTAKRTDIHPTYVASSH